MTTRVGAQRGAWIQPGLALVAAAVAGVPLVISSLDGDHVLDAFFAILVVSALAVAALVGRDGLRDRRRRLLASGIVASWLVAAAWSGFLLVMYQTACGCSSPAPATPPPTGFAAIDVATVSHVLATYGGAVLVTVAAFGRSVTARRTTEPATRLS